MVVTKFYCDICKKEVRGPSDLEELIFDTNSGGKCRYDVCLDCRKRVLNYIKLRQHPVELEGGEDVHTFCKHCNESSARSFSGERFIVCKKANDRPCVTMHECPLGSWVAKDVCLIVPEKSERQIWKEIAAAKIEEGKEQH